MNRRHNQSKAQVAIEYLLMLAAVVVVVLVGMRTLLPAVQEKSANFFNQASDNIMGNSAAIGSDGFGKARTDDLNYP